MSLVVRAASPLLALALLASCSALGPTSQLPGSPASGSSAARPDFKRLVFLDFNNRTGHRMLASTYYLNPNNPVWVPSQSTCVNPNTEFTFRMALQHSAAQVRIRTDYGTVCAHNAIRSHAEITFHDLYGPQPDIKSDVSAENGAFQLCAHEVGRAQITCEKLQ